MESLRAAVSLPKSNRIRVTMCTFIIINAARRTHFISFHTNTHSQLTRNACRSQYRNPATFFDAINYRPKNLWCKMPSKRPAMTSSKCIVSVCSSACGLWCTRVLGTTATTTKMKTEGHKKMRNEHGTILNFPCAPVGSRQPHQL